MKINMCASDTHTYSYLSTSVPRVIPIEEPYV